MAPKKNTTVNVERAARDSEKKTRAKINNSEMVPIWVDPVTGKEGEVLTYRVNGATYHVKTKQIVMVPEMLAEIIYDQARRKKLSAASVKEFDAAKTLGKEMGDLA